MATPAERIRGFFCRQESSIWKLEKGFRWASTAQTRAKGISSLWNPSGRTKLKSLSSSFPPFCFSGCKVSSGTMKKPEAVRSEQAPSAAPCLFRDCCAILGLLRMSTPDLGVLFAKRGEAQAISWRKLSECVSTHVRPLRFRRACSTRKVIRWIILAESGAEGPGGVSWRGFGPRRPNGNPPR